MRAAGVLSGLVSVACVACATSKGGETTQEDAGVEAGGGPGEAGFGVVDEAGSILDTGCATGTLRAIKDPIVMLIVLDGSGSMTEDQKWAAVVPALGAFIDDLEQHADPSFGLGLTIFSDANDPTGGNGPYNSIDVPIAYVDATQAAALHSRLQNTQPKGQTPTYEVLSGQYPLLEAFAPKPPLLPGGKKALVFMTDGVPYPDDAGTERPNSIQAVKDALGKGVITLAVGIGYTFPYDPQVYDPLFMAQLALAGGAPNQPCDPQTTSDTSMFCHMQVTPVSGGQASQLELEFSIAFDKIRSHLASCSLGIDTSKGPVDPSKVNVVFVNNYGVKSVVLEDPQDGWTYDNAQNPTKVILNGKSCDALKANVHGSVSFVLGCQTIVK
jgi:hypothetical protein